MRTVGIIAEYNPFHTGHEYHIRKAKEAAGADLAIVVMSPDYVQRGEPAIFDKHTRARMALLGGADLVIELPVCYATGSAEYFAEGAVSLLTQLGVTDVLCFGAECDDTPLFQEISAVLLHEPEHYKTALKNYIKQGKTYPQARSTALCEYLGKTGETLSTKAFGKNSAKESHNTPQKKTERMLASPNNILGIEYCKALQKYESSITPLPIKRIGSEYNSTALGGAYCSASAVRKAVKRSGTAFNEMPEAAFGKIPKMPNNSDGNLKDDWEDSFGTILHYIPRDCHETFVRACRASITSEDFLPLLAQKLLSSDSYDAILDISSDLSARMRSLRYELIGHSYDEIVGTLKTKQITQSRIQRSLLHLILGIEAETIENFRQNGTVYYANVLGFRREASALLGTIKANSAVPFLTKPSHSTKLLSGAAAQMWKQDEYASHLYRSIRSIKTGTPFQTIYETSPVII